MSGLLKPLVSCYTSMSNRKYNGGDWTPARFRQFIISTVRSAMRKWPPKYKALKSAAVGKKTNRHTGRQAEHYKCAECEKEFIAREVQVDHIKPVVDPSEGFVDWETYFDRMFCEEKNLQVLCKPCHQLKTNAERKERVNASKAAKGK